VDAWDLVIDAGSLGFIACLVPQLVRTLRRRRADDLSLAFLFLVLASSVLTLAYMAHLREWAFVVAQVANLVVWGIVLVFRVRPGRAAPS
jgi:uncharacterized protein with PQ loop repeat